MGERTRHIFIINPHAGKKDSTALITKALSDALDHEDYLTYITKEPLDAWHFVRDYCWEHPELNLRFYSCGGDGTLNEVANGAYGFPNAAVGSYPVGSGNDFIKYFGEVDRFLDIKAQVNGKCVPVDMLRFSDRLVLNILNIGFDANVAARMIKYKRLPLVSGKGAYSLGVLVSFLCKLANHFTVKVDGNMIYDGLGLLCAVANGICYGGGYYCAPEAVVDDGLLDICLVKKISRFKFIKLIKYYKEGTHLITPKVSQHIVYCKGKEVIIECQKELNYSIDGEMGRSARFKIAVIPNALNFIVPQIAKALGRLHKN